VVEVMRNCHERCLEGKEDRNLVKRLKMAKKQTTFNHDKNVHYSIDA